jgi:hypothetical protein
MIITKRNKKSIKLNTRGSSVYGSRVKSVSEILTAIVGILDCLPLFLPF